jgi:hypothetical protein
MVLDGFGEAIGGDAVTVTERLMGTGSWNLTLNPATPAHIWDRLRIAESGRGHVVITATQTDMASIPDAEALALARYSGIYLKRENGSRTLSGYGVNGWLGESDKVGRSTGAWTRTGTFAQWVTFLTDTFLQPGIVSPIPGTFKQTYEPTTFRALADLVAARFDAAWRVRPDFHFDFGTYADLFREDPIALIVRHQADAGQDFSVHGIRGDLDLVEDIEQWRRRAVYFYEADPDLPLSTILQDGGVADVDVPFRGPDGSPAFVDEITVDTRTDNSTDAIPLSLAKWRAATGVRQELTLTSIEYDIGQNVAVGDLLYVFDPDRGVYDLTREETYRGQKIHPAVIRCVGYTWPIRQGMGVWFRRWRRVPGGSWELEWIDLTPYVVWESGQTTVDVGSGPHKTLY